MSQASASASTDDHPKAILWVPDPASPAGWVRRKVWSDDEPKPKPKPPLGFMTRRRED